MSTCPQCQTEYPPNVRICAIDGTVLEEQAPVARPDAALGTLLAGKYRLDALLGRGGMGAVYKATHVMLGKAVAVKMIKPDLVGSPEMVRRFQREARAATSLDHPNIVAVYDLGETGDGTLYIAMEFVHGQSLKDVIRLGGPMEPTRIARLLAQVASALAKAHHRQIVHRDLKPHNLVLTVDGTGQECIKLLDFGIAKTFEEGATELTAAGFALGTPQYMAPEQATGQAVDGRADIYALGVILYEMLVGDVPFNASSTPAILVKHMTEPPQAPSLRRPGTDAALEAIALRCLQKEPQQRYQSAEEFAAALREAFPRDAVTSVPAVADAPTVTRPAPQVEEGGAAAATQMPASPATPSAVSQSTLPPLAPAPEAESKGTRPTVTAADPVVAAAAVATGAQNRRGGSAGRVLLVLGAVSLLLLLAVAATGYAVYRTWMARVDPGEPQATIEEAPLSVPAMAPLEPATDAAAESVGGDASRRDTAPPAPEPPTARRPPALDAAAADHRAASGNPRAGSGAAVSTASPARPAAQGASLAPQQQVAPRTEPPEPAPAAQGLPQPAAPARPALPSVLVDCSGAAEVCGAVRTAFEQELDRHGMPSVRRADRAHVVVAATASLLDTRYDQQFGTSFAVQTFSLEVSAEIADDGAVIGMPASRTFSFDPRFGKERANENARVLAGEAVGRIQRAWAGRRSN